MKGQHVFDAGRHRFSQALLAFPLAALIGFGGSVAFRAVQAHRTPESAAAPGPGRTDSDRPSRPARPASGDRAQTV